MTYTFNLIDQPWILAVSKNGRVEEIGLRQTFERAHELLDIQGETPLETAALYRLLLAILHRVFGPATLGEWRTLQQAGKLDMAKLGAYLEHWRGRFDLFDPQRPFYQAADPRVKPKSVISLVFEMASGNNAALFDHHLETSGAAISPAKAARVLLAAQAFGLAGLSGIAQKFTDAPWARGVVFLVEGETLFETLLLNLMRYTPEHPLPGSSEDRPCWEMENPFQPDRMTPLGYLDYLTWQNRRVLLFPTSDADGAVVVREITVAPALRLDETVLDPMKQYYKSEERGWLPLRFREERALWRDCHALFRLHAPAQYRPPLNVRWVSELADEGCVDAHQSYRLLALGMANDQAKIEFFRQERLPMPLDYLKEERYVELLSVALECSESASQSLRRALQLLALLILSPNADGQDWNTISKNAKDEATRTLTHWGVEREFWRRLEIPFLRLLEELPNGTAQTMEDWRAAVKRAARDALALAQELAGQSAVALKAGVRASSWLEYGLSRLS